MFDVAIIGAGPAGTAAAFDLSSNGLSVLILDKTEFPRKKACAGGITPKAYNLFKYDISSVIKQECRTIKINPCKGKPFYLRDKNTLCHMTRREDLDFFSLNKVLEKGVNFQVVKKIESITETASCVTIHTTDRIFKALYLIGADGANSRVRRLVSKQIFYKTRFALEADVKIDRPDRCQMEFDFSKFQNGYYWIFPKQDHVNIGIYSMDFRYRFQAKQLLAYAEEKLQSKRIESFKGYPICTGGVKYKPDSNRILLAGDAAGLAEPLLGEGIFFAVKSGQMAALSIIESQAGAVSAGDLYGEKLKQVHPALKCHEWGSKWFYRFPWISLRALSVPFIHKPFVKGCADGKSITQIFCWQI